MEEKENVIKEEDCSCKQEECSKETCTCEGDCTCEETCSCKEDCSNDDEPSGQGTCCCHQEEDKRGKNKKKHKKEKNDDKLNEAYSKISDLEDKLLREKAEMVNYRHRKEEEISRMLKYANEDLVLEMLPVIDNLESAIKMDDTNLEDEVSKFLEGFKLLYGNLISILEKFEIKAIDGVNKPFDATYHQAVLTEKVEGVEGGMVVDVLRKGYMLKDKVIRPAMVKVSE